MPTNIYSGRSLLIPPSENHSQLQNPFLNDRKCIPLHCQTRQRVLWNNDKA